jgi:hypothetical protein
MFKKITTNYVRLLPVRLGYLLNFNELRLKDGIVRVVNGLEGKPLFHLSPPAFAVDLSKTSPPSRASRDCFL